MKELIEINQQKDIEPSVALVREPMVPAAEVVEAVNRIVTDVRDRGDAALLDWTFRLDGVEFTPDSLEMPADERERAFVGLQPSLREAMEQAASRVAAFARRGLPQSWVEEPAPGIKVGKLERPFEAAGLYVPGGRFAYPSTVLMTGIPARVAGVGQIVFCIPPGPDGSPNRVSLAATSLVGDCRVFRVGGAQAIAAMAFGTESVPRCQVLAGPGNAYVTEAKRQLVEQVRVDTNAGPSEVAIYADAHAEPSFVAADMMAQAEHDPAAVAVVVAEDGAVLGAVEAEALMLDCRNDARDVGGRTFFVRCATRELAVAFLDALAPEHLVLAVSDAESLLGRIAAGCTFLGQYAAVALGDYVSGPSHVLPTGGAAARLSGLSASDFINSMNWIAYTPEGFAADAPAARTLAVLEGLDRHAESLAVRARRLEETGGA